MKNLFAFYNAQNPDQLVCAVWGKTKPEAQAYATKVKARLRIQGLMVKERKVDSLGSGFGRKRKKHYRWNSPIVKKYARLKGLISDHEKKLNDLEEGIIKLENMVAQAEENHEEVKSLRENLNRAKKHFEEHAPILKSEIKALNKELNAFYGSLNRSERKKATNYWKEV